MIIAFAAASMLASGLFAEVSPTPSPTPAPAPDPIASTTPSLATQDRDTEEPSPWGFSLSEEGAIRSWQDNEASPTRDDFVDGMNRLYGLATRPGVELGVQVDVAGASPGKRAGFLPGPAPAVGWTSSLLWKPRGETPVAAVVEKKFARVRNDWGTVQVGDSYRALGRGLALSLVRNSELDIDTSIEGAAADVSIGAFEAGGWAGYSNPQTITTSFVNQIARDARDMLAGGQSTVRVGPVVFGAHGNLVRVDSRAPAAVIHEGETFAVEGAEVGGGSVEVPDLAGIGDLYLEVDGVRIHGHVDDQAAERPGHGIYGAMTTYLGPLTLQAEAKDYRNLELLNFRQSEFGSSPYDYSTPPTLEKENVVNLNSNESVNSNRITGARLSASVSLGPQVVRGTYAHFQDLGHREELPDGSVLDSNERIHHGYLSVERRKGGAFVQGTVGYRHETRLADPDRNDTLMHADFDALIPIGAGMTAELKYLVYRQTEHSRFTDYVRTYDVNELVASIRPLRWLGLAALIDTTTDGRVISAHEGNLSKYAFGGVEVTVEPTDATTARLFYGATQGGLKCSGGTCRIVPAFEGFRLEWFARF